MMTTQAIDRILASPQYDEDGLGMECEAIEELIKSTGWNPVYQGLLQLLHEQRPQHHYRVAAEVIWGAVLDERPMDPNLVIALLLLRFDPQVCTGEDDNLVWSITCKLKSCSYLSDYEANDDPDVIRYLKKLRDSK